ncbi:hypothetical protein LCGC14_0147310 [marine sediment metagenome]|uniref:RecA-like N-terminal domain-containing protein n=1 Tax=marine sediment metagenome TaxID=412755 RepID=A0A0F9V3P3_9ZZZZ
MSPRTKSKTPVSRRASKFKAAQDLVDQQNAELKKRKIKAEIVTADEMVNTFTERTSTGLLGLDLIVGGGLPDGAVVQYKGKPSCAKTTAAYRHAAEVQKKFGGYAVIGHIAVEHPIDKPWARRNGFLVAYSDEEIANMEKVRGAQFSKAVLATLRSQIGAFYEVHALTGEDQLQILLDWVMSGTFDLIILDSIGALTTRHAMEVDLGGEKPGDGVPLMMTSFTKKLHSALNMKADDGEPNRTTVLGVNQFREKINTMGRGPTKSSPGGNAWKHIASLDVEFSHIESGKLYDGTKNDPKTYHLWGKEIRIHIGKSKNGAPEGGITSIELILNRKNPHNLPVGSINLAMSIRTAGDRFGLFKIKGRSNEIVKEHKVFFKDKLPEGHSMVWTSKGDLLADLNKYRKFRDYAHHYILELSNVRQTGIGIEEDDEPQEEEVGQAD